MQLFVILCCLLSGIYGCTPNVREYLGRQPQPCAMCDELLYLCDQSPKTYETVRDIRTLLRPIELALETKG